MAGSVQPSRSPEEQTTSKAIWAALKQSVITHFGDTGWGAVGASLTGQSPSRLKESVAC